MTDRTIPAGDDLVNTLLNGGVRRGDFIVIAAMPVEQPQLLIRNNNGFVYAPWFAVSTDAPCMIRLYRRVLNGNIESIQVSKRKD